MKTLQNLNSEISKILVVEDSPTQAEQLKFMLENYGYKVAVAKDGKEALELVDDFGPSLIISDVLMPEMNGYELCKAIKSGEQTKKIPVILITSLSSSNDLIESLIYSADSFISKPINEDFLISHIKKSLDASKVTGENQSEIDLEISIEGKVRSFKSNPGKMLTMLISTYEAVVQKNKELQLSHEKLKLLNENLEVMVEERTTELKRLNDQKDRFFSIIARDLKSPSNSILRFSELLVDQIRENELSGIEKYANIILQSSQRSVDLLTNLMDWSLSQTGRLEFNPEYFELVDHVNQLTQSLASFYQQKNISIVNQMPRHLVVFADKVLIGSVMRNLISNAIKFTKPGGNIILSAQTKPAEIIICVADTGVGIPKDAIDKLFRIDKNYATHGTQNEKGSGLGLIVCKEFIEKHNGKIWVISEKGKGSEFYFSIPCNIES